MSEPSKAEIAIAAIKARLYHRAEIMETRDEIQIKTWGDQARARGWYDGGARQVLRPYVIDLDALTPAAQLVVALLPFRRCCEKEIVELVRVQDRLTRRQRQVAMQRDRLERICREARESSIAHTYPMLTPKTRARILENLPHLTYVCMIITDLEVDEILVEWEQQMSGFLGAAWDARESITWNWDTIHPSQMDEPERYINEQVAGMLRLGIIEQVGSYDVAIIDEQLSTLISPRVHDLTSSINKN